MKNIITTLVLILSFSVVQATNTKTDEKVCINYSIGINDCLVQFQETGNIDSTVQNGKGLNLYHIEGSGYDSSIEAIGYCKSVQVTSGIIGNTNLYQEFSCNSIIKESWRRDTSGMHLRRAEGSGEDLQGNHYLSTGNYGKQEGDYYSIREQNELFPKAVLLDRHWSCRTDFRPSRT